MGLCVPSLRASEIIAWACTKHALPEYALCKAATEDSERNIFRMSGCAGKACWSAAAGTLATATELGLDVFAVSARAANYTVKPGGGGNYATIRACASALSAGDTCTVYAGTYNEDVTLARAAI
jgi:hypothetical protein